MRQELEKLLQNAKLQNENENKKMDYYPDRYWESQINAFEQCLELFDNFDCSDSESTKKLI